MNVYCLMQYFHTFHISDSLKILSCLILENYLCIGETMTNYSSLCLCNILVRIKFEILIINHESFLLDDMLKKLK